MVFEINKIYNKDCLDLMDDIGKIVDVVLTSPFYNTNKKAGKTRTLKNTKHKITITRMFGMTFMWMICRMKSIVTSLLIYSTNLTACLKKTELSYITCHTVVRM